MYEQNQVVPDLASALNLLEQQRLTINQLNGVIDDLCASLDNSRASESRALDIKESYKAKRDQIVNFIQSSIDRGDWEPSELEEIFWEELAEIADLRLKRTKEVEIRVTLTYSGSITVPVECDIDSDIDIECLSNELSVTYKSEPIDDQWVTFENQEIEESIKFYEEEARKLAKKIDAAKTGDFSGFGTDFFDNPFVKTTLKCKKKLTFFGCILLFFFPLPFMFT